MKTINKILAVLLVLTLIFACTLPAFAAGLPAGVSESDVLKAKEKTEILFDALSEKSVELSDLSGKVYGMLFADDTLNEVFWSLYGGLQENASTLSALGIDISVSAVANALNAYPDAAAVLLNAGNWETLVTQKPVLKFHITDKNGFKNCVSAMLSPLNPLLYVMLCAGNYNVNVLISLRGDNGYQNAVVPILTALGCQHIMTQQAFTAQAGENRGSMISNILDMLFQAVDNILANPIDGLCRYLPSIAYYLKNIGLSSAFETLIAPLKVRVGLFSLTGIDKLLENMQMFSDASALADMLEDVDISALTGSDLKLELPDVALDAMAQTCTCKDGVYTVNIAESFTVVLQWLLDAARLNVDRLGALAGMDMNETVTGVLNRLLNRSNETLLQTVFRLFNMESQQNTLEYAWTYPEFTPQAVEFTPNLTRENYEKVLNEIDGTLNEFLTEFGDGSLSGLLASKIYSGDLISQLTVGLYGALYSDKTAGLLELLGIDASPKGVADAVRGAFPTAAQYLAAQGDWKNVKAEKISWGITAGERSGFEKAILSVLKPLVPALDILLAEGSITVLDVITVNGSNGYNTAVIPILEGLGCPDASVRTYKTYKAAKGTDNAVYYIVDPLLDLVDTLIDKPVATLCGMLPNIVYFLNSGAINTCLSNLMYPVNKLLKELDMEDLMPAEITGLGSKLNIETVINQLTASGDLGLTLPAPDLTKVASLGTATTKKSNRTYNGNYENYTYIVADSPAVLVTVLRYVITALGSEENADMLSSLMSGEGGSDDAGGMPDMFKMYAGNITQQLKTMSTDETIEWLYDLLFAETPTREETTTLENIPTIKYEKKEDNTKRNVGLIAAVVVVAILGFALIASRVDFSAKRERRQRKKLQKKNEKAAKKERDKIYRLPDGFKGMADGTVSAIQEDETTGVFSESGQNTDKELPETSEKEKPLAKRIENDREAVKLKIRQEKAMQKAIRDTKKADRYYEQALREAGKKR